MAKWKGNAIDIPSLHLATSQWLAAQDWWLRGELPEGRVLEHVLQTWPMAKLEALRYKKRSRRNRVKRDLLRIDVIQIAPFLQSVLSDL